ncbi:MAG: HD domain-containing phosphohydrolase [Nitrospirota bacterium]
MGPFTYLIEEVAPSILVVDDIQSNLELMEAIFLKEGFRVYTALNADIAMGIFGQHNIDLAVLDVMMPGIDGFELCSKLKEISGKRFFPVILLTALTDQKSKIKGLESGADDFISKPFDPLELTIKIKSLLKLKSLQEDLEHSENIILTLAVALEANDPYTKGHSTRVGELSSEFVSFLGLHKKNQEDIKKAGILHDIGKIGISKSLLHKRGELTEEEREIIKRHAVIGEEICKPLVSMKRLLSTIRHHHERWDGNGFPDGLIGNEIPLMARILSIIDSFDAMVSMRPYRARKSAKEALKIMESEWHQGQWDPELLKYFIEMMTPLLTTIYK